MTKLSTRIADLERQLRRLVQRPDSLDLVDTLTLMELSVGGGDVAATWHAIRRRLGVEDDGSGAERVRRLRSAELRATKPV